MSTLTIRIPDEKYERLKALAASRKVSVNKLVDELSTIALVEFDAHNRFKARASRGDAEHGLGLLDKLNRLESDNKSQ